MNQVVLVSRVVLDLNTLLRYCVQIFHKLWDLQLWRRPSGDHTTNLQNSTEDTKTAFGPPTKQIWQMTPYMSKVACQQKSTFLIDVFFIFFSLEKKREERGRCLTNGFGNLWHKHLCQLKTRILLTTQAQCNMLNVLKETISSNVRC